MRIEKCNYVSLTRKWILVEVNFKVHIIHGEQWWKFDRIFMILFRIRIEIYQQKYTTATDKLDSVIYVSHLRKGERNVLDASLFLDWVSDLWSRKNSSLYRMWLVIHYIKIVPHGLLLLYYYYITSCNNAIYWYNLLQVTGLSI